MTRFAGRAPAQEAKLAETAPTRPLALTIGAAAVTLAVVVGILAGPTIVNCFDSSQGMGMCLRGELTESGLLPSDAPTPGPQPQTAAGTDAPETPPQAAPELEEDAGEDVVAATFGLLRAEPDGSVVIAGSGTPGSEVEIYSNEDLIGRATVEPSGDWVLVPEEPIPPGGTEITLAEAGKEGRAAQSFVVVIDPERDEQPLVVASEPGQASEILQGLERPRESIAVASLPGGPEPAAESAGAANAVPGSSAPSSDETVDAGQPAAEEPAPDEPSGEAGAAPTAASDDSPVSAPDEPVAESEPAEATTGDAPVEVAVAEPAEVDVPQPAPDTPRPAANVPPPTVDAIEIDGDRTFFAGAGPEGATIRLYVDGTFVADALVEGGRWLVEAGDLLSGLQHAVRADLLASGSADVISRAEVDFRIDVPEDPVTEAASEPEADGSSASAPDASPAPTTVAQSGEPAEPVESGEVTTLVAEPVGDPELQRFASGRAIIRRGDNLWTIARRVYGEGIRYTTIYQANTDQIRDPDRIYPGQVFSLPQAD